ncbi:MAG: hypothetical protein LBS85_02485 [Clostridiales Family XIII bacterium]|jgi:Tfp pilus assembly major pilin PilA|nr:hypothetical protein [Clostridiales Family XIII bacterium]
MEDITKAKTPAAQKGGFIVAELLVVLVILALLAALLLPKVLHYIDEAKSNAEIAETRTVTVTLQSILSLNYDSEPETDAAYFDRTDTYNIRLTDRAHEEMVALCETELGDVDHILIGGGNMLISYQYRTLLGSVVLYKDGDYSVLELY